MEECGRIDQHGRRPLHHPDRNAWCGLGIIAMSVYEIRLTAIPISFRHWPSLIALFLLAILRST